MRVSYSNGSFPGILLNVISTEASVQAFVEVPKAFVDVTSRKLSWKLSRNISSMRASMKSSPVRGRCFHGTFD